MAAIVAAVQQRVVQPAHTPVATSRVFVQIIVGKQGQLEHVELVQATNPAIDAAVLAAVRQLPTFVPGRQVGQPVRVSLTLAITPPGLVEVPTAPGPPNQELAELIETRTLLRGEARRQRGEVDSSFVRRVLPRSFAESHDLLAATWRASAFGKQLFFSLVSTENTDYGSELFILDPYLADTYAVYSFTIPSLGDATSLSALFFADVNQDGQKELLALSESSLAEIGGRETHYQTQVFQYVGLTSVGRPQYREDTTPPAYLDGLATVAAVRQALAAPRVAGKPAKK
jgi:hypothetical protein